MKNVKQALLAGMLLLVLLAAFGCGNKDVTGNDNGDNEKYKEQPAK